MWVDRRRAPPAARRQCRLAGRFPLRVSHIDVSLGERIVIHYIDSNVELVSEINVAGADVGYPCPNGHALQRSTHIAAVVVLAGGKELDLAAAFLQTFAGHLVSIAKPVLFRIAAPEVLGINSVIARIEDADHRPLAVFQIKALVCQRKAEEVPLLDGQGVGGVNIVTALA